MQQRKIIAANNISFASTLHIVYVQQHEHVYFYPSKMFNRCSMQVAKHILPLNKIGRV